MFKFKNISSDKMSVVAEEEEHFIARASQKLESIDIEGKNGTIYNLLGYSSIERPIKISVLDVSKIDDILDWLNGEGIFEYKGRVTKALFYSAIEPQRVASIRTIDTKFIRSPFWYKSNDDYITVSDSISNEGNVESSPIIRLEKNDSDSIDLTIGGIRFIYNFLADDYVEIDCEELTVLYENLSRNRQIEIGYEFPKLPVGSSQIYVHSGDATIKVKRKDCWL